jgi:hypothetical protein
MDFKDFLKNELDELQKQKKEKQLSLYTSSQKEPKYYPAISDELVSDTPNLNILDLPKDIQDSILKRTKIENYMLPEVHQGIVNLSPEEQSKWYNWRDKEISPSIKDLGEVEDKIERFSNIRKTMKKGK